MLGRERVLPACATWQDHPAFQFAPGGAPCKLSLQAREAPVSFKTLCNELVRSQGADFPRRRADLPCGVRVVRRAVAGSSGFSRAPGPSPTATPTLRHLPQDTHVAHPPGPWSTRLLLCNRVRKRMSISSAPCPRGCALMDTTKRLQEEADFAMLCYIHFPCTGTL